MWGHCTNVALWGYLDCSLTLYDIKIKTILSGVIVHIINTLGGYFNKRNWKCPKCFCLWGPGLYLHFTMGLLKEKSELFYIGIQANPFGIIVRIGCTLEGYVVKKFKCPNYYSLGVDNITLWCYLNKHLNGITWVSRAFLKGSLCIRDLFCWRISNVQITVHCGGHDLYLYYAIGLWQWSEWYNIE